MPAAKGVSAKRVTLNLRIKPAERDLIDRAAKARGKNRTDFVLEAARVAAEEASGIPRPLGSGSWAKCCAA